MYVFVRHSPVSDIPPFYPRGCVRTDFGVEPVVMWNTLIESTKNFVFREC